jgi:predicted ATPase
LFYLGYFVQAHAHLEQGIAQYNLPQHSSLAFLYGQDPGVTCRAVAAWVLWLLGYPEQALTRSQEAVSIARELTHLPSLALALGFASHFHLFRREGKAAQERAEAALTLSTDRGFTVWLASGTILRGWALAEQGQGKEGITQIRQGLAAYRATGSEISRPYYLTLLAEAYGKVGQPGEGLTTLAEALAVVDNTGERWWEAELYRLKGELTLQSKVQSPRPKVEEEAEECFQKAIDIARRQQAKSLELRAVMSLARPWQQQGKREEARQMLAEIYGWFTEGFDTADLKEAKTLLEQLS